jgi:hypothetical protein
MHRLERKPSQRLHRAELDREVGWLTIPEPPLLTMLSTDLLAAPLSSGPVAPRSDGEPASDPRI